MDSVKIERKLKLGVATIIVLLLCLCVTTFALVYATVSVENHIFSTATVSINLNDGEPVIEEEGIYFAPGRSVQKEFFIMNTGSVDAWYKLYFTNVEGSLANKIEVLIEHDGEMLYKGLLASLTAENVYSTDDALAVGEKRVLTITFYMQSGSENVYQGGLLTFDISADAVQVKNNPDRIFD